MCRVIEVFVNCRSADAKFLAAGGRKELVRRKTRALVFGASTLPQSQITVANYDLSYDQVSVRAGAVQDLRRLAAERSSLRPDIADARRLVRERSTCIA